VKSIESTLASGGILIYVAVQHIASVASKTAEVLRINGVDVWRKYLYPKLTTFRKSKKQKNTQPQLLLITWAVTTPRVASGKCQCMFMRIRMKSSHVILVVAYEHLPLRKLKMSCDPGVLWTTPWKSLSWCSLVVSLRNERFLFISFYLLEGESMSGGRGRGRSRLLPEQGPWAHEPSWSQMLNWLELPGRPFLLFVFLSAHSSYIHF